MMMRQRDKFCRRVRASGKRYMKMYETYSRTLTHRLPFLVWIR